jgi:2'-5' RNA ligase
MDVRTFVTLETTLAQRLLKDWRAQSDPIYQKITKACHDGRWDEACRLVPELDLTPVGTRRKEWIRFILDSFAHYGASRAAQGKSLLAGTPVANEAVEQALNQIQMYLEHAGTTQVQVQALQLIAADEAAHKTVKAEYSYGIVMAAISPDSEMGNYLAIAQALIAEDDLAGGGKDVGGFHVTVRYGIQGGWEAIKEYVAKQPTFTMMLGQIRIFEPSESSDGAAPVVVDIVSEELHRMHEELEHVGDWKASSFPEYLPHATLAYIKPEAIEKYQKLKDYGVLAVEGSQYWVQYLTVSDPNDTPEQIWLDGGDSDEFKPISDFVRRQKADASGRFVTPFVSFDNQGSDQLQLIASLNGSRLATWGFTAEAGLRGIKR